MYEQSPSSFPCFSKKKKKSPQRWCTLDLGKGRELMRRPRGAQFFTSTTSRGRLLPPNLVPANFLVRPAARAQVCPEAEGELAASRRLIYRPEHSQAAPPGVGLSSDFGEVMMDTGHVATQWGHTTDLSHFGKLPLPSEGGRSVLGAPGLRGLRSSPQGSALLSAVSTPRAPEGAAGPWSPQRPLT